ncbi:hypothetical protein J5N97_001580 [Dioscorea zingiberensis]|uniref:Uncharacterized protein n=1 Tax=Dioscorea zingiberensis TaxID=325984 RepID=A0A9D5H294_9LILI|nr:hypothetical protein J5N97_001580 [Dioscorea zingiberensis]
MGHLLDEVSANLFQPDDQPCAGEVGLFPLYMGTSNRLLNADHKKVNFDGMPTYRGMKLRRHGDIIQRTVGGYYIVQGRADDTMNLGGIKTSAVEIERVCNRADGDVLETAAISTRKGEFCQNRYRISPNCFKQIVEESSQRSAKTGISHSKQIITNLS